MRAAKPVFQLLFGVNFTFFVKSAFTFTSLNHLLPAYLHIFTL